MEFARSPELPIQQNCDCNLRTSHVHFATENQLQVCFKTTSKTSYLHWYHLTGNYPKKAMRELLSAYMTKQTLPPRNASGKFSMEQSPNNLPHALMPLVTSISKTIWNLRFEKFILLLLNTKHWQLLEVSSDLDKEGSNFQDVCSNLQIKLYKNISRDLPNKWKVKQVWNSTQ